MAGQEFTVGVQLADLSLDDEGNVLVSNPAVARAISDAIASGSGGAAARATNTCHGGNCAKGCGGKLAAAEA